MSMSDNFIYVNFFHFLKYFNHLSQLLRHISIITIEIL